MKRGLWTKYSRTMKRHLVLALSLLICTTVLAVPARPFPFVVKQPDGTELTLTLIGDERFHYYVTEDGITVLQECTGKEISYFYATVKDGTLTPSNILAHQKGKRSIKERRFIKSERDAVAQCIERKKAAMRSSAMTSTTLSDAMLPGSSSHIGEKKGLVILVNFADYAMSAMNPKETFNRVFNEVGYSDNGHIGSVHDYFYDQSYGQFNLTFDVAGPVTVSREITYYGKNDIVLGRDDIRIGRLVSEACRLADKEIDYSAYDWNGDGTVEQVYLIYAGYGEATGGASYTIWPHKFSLTGCQYWGDGDGPLYLDGVKIDTYACSCELSGNTGNTLTGIGMACHEFSHCLGLPDLYDVDYSGAFGMDRWDIMDHGSYSGPNGNGEVPYGYSAYEKACAGWITLTELTEEEECILPPLNNDKKAYRINNNGNMNEFFVLENHQSYGWYSYFGKGRAPHGMMVTHVDYSSQAWDKNTVNTYPSHMRVSIVPADKDYGTFDKEAKGYYLTEEEYSGDLFPGNSNAIRFSSESYENCGGKLFNTNIDGSYNLSMNIDNITEYIGIISFTVGERLNVPKNIEAALTGEKLCIQWDEVENAVEYSAEILKIKSIMPIRIETEIIDDIHGARIEFDAADCMQANIRLKALNSYVSSEWSEPVKAKTYTDGIVSPKDGNSDGNELYTVDGFRIDQPHKKGIFILKENNVIKKKYIRP